MSIGMGSGKKAISSVILITFSLFLFGCADKERKNTPLESYNNILNDNKEKKESIFYKTKIDSITKKEVYLIVDELPKYRNDAFDFSKYILQNMKSLPEYDIYRIQFIIDEKGYLLGARVKNKKESQLTAYEKELLSILDSMPRWHPAKYKGKGVSYLMDIPLRMDIQK